MTEAFIWDAGTAQERVTSPEETQELLAEMDAVFRRECADLIYYHKVGGETRLPGRGGLT